MDGLAGEGLGREIVRIRDRKLLFFVLFDADQIFGERFFDDLVAKLDLKIVGRDRLAVRVVVELPSRSAMTVSPISDGRPSTGISAASLLQPVCDQVFDLAVLDRLDAAGYLDAFVFRFGDLRHHLDVNMQLTGCEPFTFTFSTIVEMQMRLGQRMEIMLLDRLGHRRRQHLLQHLAPDLFLKTQTHDIERRIALSKAGHGRSASVLLAHLAVRLFQRVGVDLYM